MCYERTAGRQRVHGACVGSTGMGWEGRGSPIVDNFSLHSTASLVYGWELAKYPLCGTAVQYGPLVS